MSVAEEVVASVMAETGWTRDEAVNVLQCIRADSPEALLDHVPRVIGWAITVETRHSMLSLMKTLPSGVLECEWQDGDIGLRFSPDVQVDQLPNGTINVTTKAGDEA